MESVNGSQRENTQREATAGRLLHVSMNVQHRHRTIVSSPSDQAELLSLEAHFHLSFACWAKYALLGDPHLWTAATSPGATRSEQQHTLCLTSHPLECNHLRSEKKTVHREWGAKGKYLSTRGRKFTQTLCSIITIIKKRTVEYLSLSLTKENRTKKILNTKIQRCSFQSLCEPASERVEWASCSAPCRVKQAAPTLLQPAHQSGARSPETRSGASLHTHSTYNHHWVQ